jgi:hypothetical protein
MKGCRILQSFKVATFMKGSRILQSFKWATFMKGCKILQSFKGTAFMKGCRILQSFKGATFIKAVELFVDIDSKGTEMNSIIFSVEPESYQRAHFWIPGRFLELMPTLYRADSCSYSPPNHAAFVSWLWIRIDFSPDPAKTKLLKTIFSSNF